MIFNLIKRFNCTASLSYSDVLICGGGLIGTTVSCALAKHTNFIDKSLALIEASPLRSFNKHKHYSNRVSAISPFSKSLFDKLGIWRHVLRYKEVNKLKIWGVYSDNFLELEANEDGVVAYIVENDDLIQAVSRELHSLPNVRQIHKANISSVNIEEVPSCPLPTVVLDNGSKLSCQLLIGADGQNSMIRKAMDVNYLSWNYHQMAIVATLKISDVGPNSTAWQKFLPEGPVALLPLTNDLSSLVWSTTKPKALNLLKLPKDNFIDALNTSLQTQGSQNQLTKAASKGLSSVLNYLGLVHHSVALGPPPIINDIVEDSRAVFPLGFGHSTNYVCPHVVLIGDAAHRVHPLAGQGVNLGFKDIACLESVLSEGLRNGRELGDIEVLKKFETLAQQNNVPVMASIELIHRIYTSQFGPIQTLGDIALQIANICEPLKKQINSKVLFSRT